MWLRAERQTGGRGRIGRAWASPPGNLYASTLVRLREGDPPAPTLALTAGIALHETMLPYFRNRGTDLSLKWPNDLLVGTRKLAGILLERVDKVVVIGIGANLSSHPDDTDRPATSLAAETMIAVGPDIVLADLADRFAGLVSRWRDGLPAIRDAWLAAAHPVGTLLSTHDASGAPLVGTFDGLETGGACRLRLADGEARLIHAGDVFLA